MADTDELKKTDADEPKKEEEAKTEPTNKAEPSDKAEAAAKKGLVGRILPWIILAAVVVLFAGGGFAVGRLFAGKHTAETTQASQEDTSQKTQPETDVPNLTGGKSEKSWYYDLEPVVANLDEPGVTRYVRATLTLEVSQDVDIQKGTAFFEEKKPILTNWLTIYLASLNLEDIRGDMNLKRIQARILDAFNEKLFPDAKPQINGVLFKEFAVQ
ncbi:MAG: flagellar basal body-associated FliL family protein [Planctomycetota bacterium]|jgi:flagellar basal body-associated protein FliL